jgi:ABC-type nickel/cobalt efflux system permease component RcnA
MKFTALLSTTIGLLFIFTSSNGHAAGHAAHDHDDHHEHIQHEAHEHGVARLTLAAEGKRLEIMLESPAANIVGFEHSAATAEEEQKLAEAKAKLAKGESLFRINPEAQCSLSSSEIESALFEDDVHENHDHHEGHDHHDEHTDHEEGEAHNDIDVSWVFSCAKPSALRTVETGLFDLFPAGFEEIMVEWITATNASARTIHQDEVIELK